MPTAADLITAANDDKPLEFEKGFEEILSAKVAELIATRKQEIAREFLGVHDAAPPDEPEKPAEVEEPDADEQSAVEEPVEEGLIKNIGKGISAVKDARKERLQSTSKGAFPPTRNEKS